jgi:hypothetical protein
MARLILKEGNKMKPESVEFRLTVPVTSSTIRAPASVRSGLDPNGHWN